MSEEANNHVYQEFCKVWEKKDRLKAKLRVLKKKKKRLSVFYMQECIKVGEKILKKKVKERVYKWQED